VAMVISDSCVSNDTKRLALFFLVNLHDIKPKLAQLAIKKYEIEDKLEDFFH